MRRKPTSDELQSLRVQANYYSFGRDLCHAWCAAVLVLFVGILFSRLTGLLRHREYWHGLFALIIGAVLLIWLRKSPKLYGNKKRADLVANAVDEIEYEAIAAIRVKQLGRMGINYYLKLADGKVLFISGKYLYGLERAKKFPSTRFKLTQAVHTREVLNLTPTGNFLPPLAVLPAFTKEQFRRGEIPGDGTLLDLNFETLQTGAQSKSR